MWPVVYKINAQSLRESWEELKCVETAWCSKNDKIYVKLKNKQIEIININNILKIWCRKLVANIRRFLD